MLASLTHIVANHGYMFSWFPARGFFPRIGEGWSVDLYVIENNEINPLKDGLSQGDVGELIDRDREQNELSYFFLYLIHVILAQSVQNYL